MFQLNENSFFVSCSDDSDVNVDNGDDDDDELSNAKQAG